MIRKNNKNSNRMERQSKLCDSYAHRGYHDKPAIPENSMAAFRRALENGFNVELDVHLIADGSLVVFHDEELERETAVAGLIEDYDLSNLKRLRLEGTDEQIPTFEEVLELFESMPREDGSICSLLVELKVVRGNYKQLVRKTCEMLDRHRVPYVMESFDPRAVIELRRTRPEIVRGQLSRNFFLKPDMLPFWQAVITSNLLLNFIAKPDFVAYKFADRNNRALKRALRRGCREASWTIKTAKQYKAARRAGCTAIFERFDPRTVE